MKTNMDSKQYEVKNEKKKEKRKKKTQTQRNQVTIVIRVEGKVKYYSVLQKG